MNTIFRIAQNTDVGQIWEILQSAIERRKKDGSNQWQDGYPNPEVVNLDIANSHGYVLCNDEEIIGYCALLVDDEPDYEVIEGKWLTESEFVVFHRVAISEKYIGKGQAQKMMLGIEEQTKSWGIRSIKADTNFDNAAMLKIFEKMGYNYCGKVYMRGSPRRAYEKVLDATDIGN